MPRCNTCRIDVERRIGGQCSTCYTIRTSEVFHGIVTVNCEICGRGKRNRDVKIGFTTENKSIILCNHCWDTCNNTDAVLESNIPKTVCDGKYCYENIRLYGATDYCEDCLANLDLFHCFRCNEESCNDNAYCVNILDNIVEYCIDCVDNHTVACQNCDTRHVINISNCPECGYTYNSSSRRVIHNYSYKPTPEFLPIEPVKDNYSRSAFNSNSKTLYLGVELECECNGNRDVAALLATQLGHGRLYVKSDSTVCSGFEMVTHPSTLVMHKRTGNWKAILESTIKNKCISHNTSSAGLHVHVNKNYLTEAQRVKLEVFVQTHIKEITRFSRRKKDSFAKFRTLDKEDFKRLRSNGRMALNWGNSQTVEFRMFKGTLKYSTFIATIEFVDALVNFIKSTSTYGSNILYDRGLAWDAFIAYVKKYSHIPVQRTQSVDRHIHYYTCLLPYLKEKKLIDGVKLATINKFDQLLTANKSGVNSSQFEDSNSTEVC